MRAFLEHPQIPTRITACCYNLDMTMTTGIRNSTNV